MIASLRAASILLALGFCSQELMGVNIVIGLGDIHNMYIGAIPPK